MTMQTLPPPGQIHTWAGGGGMKGDQIIYYRKPNRGEEAGWITWGDSVSGSKLRDMIRRGFTPLMQYGVINSIENMARARSDGERIWGPILRHPEGPSEFPIEQVLTYRWYRPEECPVVEAVFPQLSGMRVKEYRCPECRHAAPYVDTGHASGVRGLATHLRVTHGWDRVSLMAYGERIGVDFNQAWQVMGVEEYVVGERESVTAAAAAFICDECGRGFAKKIALAGHMRSHPKPLVEIETIG